MAEPTWGWCPDAAASTYAATVRVCGRQFALVERGEQEALLALWGEALSADSGIQSSGRPRVITCAVTMIDADPVTGDVYAQLPWDEIGLRILADQANRRMVVTTHFLLVQASRDAGSAAARLRLLGAAVADTYNGLDSSDGEALADGWTTLLADLAGLPEDLRTGWAALYGESTGAWWPPHSTSRVRGIVNAIIRSPEVEALHAGKRVTFFDNQLGAFCANWAAASLLGDVLGCDPESWGLVPADWDRARARPRFGAVAELFPGTGVVRAAGQAAAAGRSIVVECPSPGTEEQACRWLADHADPSGMSTTTTGSWSTVSVRHAWTAPDPSELALLPAPCVWGMATLTRLSRDPRHLAATLQWAALRGVVVVTPNVYLAVGQVSLRTPPVPAPSTEADPIGANGTHADSWHDSTGLSEEHARALRHVVGPTTRPGRNEVCWCGSSAKFKRCHGKSA